MVSETGLWFLAQRHPEAVEPAGGGAWWVYLDQPYRAERVADRAFYRLMPEPSRRRGGS
jgi:hypothetical protein